MASQNLVTSSIQARMELEKQVQRNPHPDFKTVEASREPWDKSAEFKIRQTRNPDWKFGDGANDGGASLKHNHMEINPYEQGRPAIFNYKLLISGIVPRPIGFISTRSSDGTSTNLAPYSYTQVINHDPPLFVIGISGGFDNAKDTLKNLTESKECVINIVSEHFIEAANATSINTPFGVSEWALTGLTPAKCSVVKASRVKEAVFAVEARLESVREWESRGTPGKKTGVMAVVEGVNFWVRDDAINEERNMIDPAILRPMARMGGITYARVLEGLELPRPDWASSEEARKLAHPKVDGQ